MSDTHFVGLVQKYIRLHTEKKITESALERITAEVKALEEELLPLFEQGSVDRMGALGKTVYIHRQLWPRNTVSSETTTAALKASGLDALVREKYNSNSLAAYVREVRKEHEVDGLPLNCEQVREFLPKPLQGAIEVTEKIGLRVRSS